MCEARFDLPKSRFVKQNEESKGKMKKKRVFLAVVLTLCFIVTAGCGNVLVPVITNVPEFTSTFTQAPTETPEPRPTSTPTQAPTETPEPSPTPTLAPTPTAIPTPVFTSIENDLSPSFAQSISTEYMGVKFNLELITDSSLNPEITKIQLEDGFEHTLAAVVAVDMFEIWWVKGPVPHKYDKNDFDLVELQDEFNSFMGLWAKAQETNNPEDWEKVQINRILANNLNDNNGYQMNYYNFWMMYSGDTPAGITSVKTFSIAFVYTTEVENIQISWQSSYSGEFIKGYGLNLDKDRLLVYLGHTDFRYAEKPLGCGVSCVPAVSVRFFTPITVMSSISAGYKFYYSDFDITVSWNLRDHLIVSP